MTARTSIIIVIIAALLLPFDSAGTERRSTASMAIDGVVAGTERQPVRYRALRRLEATTAKMHGWMEATMRWWTAASFFPHLVGVPL